jgi:ferrous iron transport protein B
MSEQKSPPVLDHKPHIETHPHIGHEFLDKSGKRRRLVLAGNPNVGKSVFFNYFSGIYADVSNYPGTTIEITQGIYRSYDVYDTPGIYGVSSFNDEEIVARDIIIAGDVILNIVDAVHLERDLFLTLQLIDMGKKLIVALNFMDEARKHNIAIDIDRLQSLLGVTVIPTVAIKKQGFRELEASLPDARKGSQDPELHHKLHELLNRTGSEAEALLVLEGDPNISAVHGVNPLDERDDIYIKRRNRVNRIIAEVLADRSTTTGVSTLAGRWAVNPWTGIPAFLVMLYLTYLFVGKLVAQDLVDFTVDYLGKEVWEIWIGGIVTRFVSETSWLGVLLIGEFGVLTMTVTYLLFLLLPLVAAFYLVLSLMEDSGYLPRLATLADRGLSYFGLNGRAVIPLILGFGCVTAAIITTRLLGNEREKTIATALLQFAIPCSAQIAVIATLLASAGFTAVLIYGIVILSVFILAGTLLNRFIPGQASPLLIDLPPMRIPRFENVVRKTWNKSFFFMKEAIPWFFFGALAVGIMQLTGILTVWQQILAPFTTGWLKLPREAATAFVMGLVRRDFGAAGLYDMSLEPMQITVALITITLFVPCIASLMIMLKERGIKQSALIWFGTWIGAFLIGGIVAQIIIR